MQRGFTVKPEDLVALKVNRVMNEEVLLVDQGVLFCCVSGLYCAGYRRYL